MIEILPGEASGKKIPERARKALDQFADGRRAVIAQRQEYTFGQLWKLWQADREQDGKSNAIHKYNWVSLAPVFENRNPASAKADDYRNYAKARFALGRAPDTVHTELIRLRQCLKWAFDSNLIERAPLVWLPSAGRKRDRVLTPDEAKALLIAARSSDPHVNLFIILLFSTGGRHTAILDLEWSRIDFRRRVIDLEVDLPPDPMNKSWRKGRAEMVMTQIAYDVLLVAHDARSPSGFVVEHGGARLTTCRDGFRAACERAGLGWYVEDGKGGKRFKTDVTPHTIRHTIASWADDENVDVKEIAQLLGHEDERTTRLTYIHARPEKTATAAAMIDKRLAALPNLIDETRNKECSEAEVVPSPVKSTKPETDTIGIIEGE
ncbi:MAG: site-specific integrase [Hyphomicrobiaceae bacterium]|nr:site-specific integrase [Hyphomicrobiaceae bacterium]